MKIEGIHTPLPFEKMDEHTKRLRQTYAITPGIRLIRREFGFFTEEIWCEQGLHENTDYEEEFKYDPYRKYGFWKLGWCEAAFSPVFPTLTLEERGEHEVIQDFAGRKLLVFKGRRRGFMPEYIDHPVKDMKTWEENVKWRLSPNTSERFGNDFEKTISEGTEKAKQGWMITQHLIGGYMYLRSLIGPQELLYAFYDQPELIHDCMKTWFELADAVIARVQKHLTFDEIFFAEDICYNHGCLISPEMMKEFLFPYYQQLIKNLRTRQLDPSRHLYVQVDTDGFANPVIDLYRDAINMDAMSPFEVASGCSVVEIGKKYPNLFISGGIDKRVLAKGKDAIDKHLESILPAMRERGGYIPTCDHGVPAEVSLDNYRYYRKRCIELGG